jgi:hypothetical protein
MVEFALPEKLFKLDTFEQSFPFSLTDMLNLAPASTTHFVHGKAHVSS